MPARPLRADALRNRDLLIEVATRAFTRDGEDATFEAIAKEAGLGIGTLYRHFPTREALVEAVYRGELAGLSASAEQLLAASGPETGLREWMGRFVDFMTTKRGMADVLRAVINSGGNPYEQSRERALEAVAMLLDAGAAAGTIRADVDPLDVLTTLNGFSLAAVEPGQTDRLIDLLMDGLLARRATTDRP
ncbi:MAG TPA: TetR/AcrR family transcriptional regulator [Lacisediminihabitans sp.]|uniref:TetR/AcrR family transcriptional regulator n=1 Tax=Lacisediminihabitans sp. TaxID=2787631 RepID=UPI002EDB6D63